MSVMKKSFVGRCIDVIKEKGLMGFLKKINARHFDPFKIIFYPSAALHIKKTVNRTYTAQEAVEFVFNRFGGYLKPYQFKSEITNLAKIAEYSKPKTVLEIGTSTGGTLFIWSRLATKDAHLISIDLPGGENDWAYPKWKEGFYKKFAGPLQKIDLIRADSQSPDTLAHLKKILGNEQVDFLFIDADHSYKGVKADYELYSPLVKKGGVIAFHDIVNFPDPKIVNVKQLWDEAKKGKQYKEFIESPTQKWGGIGVIFV